MKKSIKSFSLHKTALTVAVTMAALSLVLVIPMAMIFTLAAIFDSSPGNGMSLLAPSLGMIFAMPILYLIMGYIMTIVFAAIYNVVAKYTGGITFEVGDRQA
ncbi:hypothetical protein [Aliidiomarina haloalkalitolerans]|uniref:DUF3566 domain-containing protein n=1 Tax=Aliidiomarina haloalkalitolerans TaxID=859059 RepID=A0A432VS18_9GAMM|nr:hypothetical protein [Aliidiomarina haloalkalitolerans]RUO19134.1 hypothetical protein CWE06_08840 [Aliidiomarina haloalkalitolerans]